MTINIRNQKRILLVEDFHDVAKSIKDRLESEGYIVDIVDTESAAIASLRNKIYDAALVDLQLKDDTTHKGGINVLREMKLLNEGIKGIVVTGSSDISDAKASFDQGIFGFLLKNEMTPKDVLEELEKLFKEQRRKSFGDYPNLSVYLASPDITPIWEDHVFQCIGCTYNNLQEAIWKSLSSYLPVLRTKDGAPSFILDHNKKAISGILWSKAEGFAIWFSAANKIDNLIAPSENLQPRGIFSNIFSDKISTKVWRLLSADRKLFLDYISDYPWQKK